MKRAAKIFAGVSVAFALSACNSNSSTGSIGGGVTGGGSVAVPTLAKLIGDAKTVGGSATDLTLSAKKGTATEAQVAVTTRTHKDADGNADGLHVTVGKNSYDLTTFNATDTQLSNADGSVRVFTQTGRNGVNDTFDQLADGTGSNKYHTILGYDMSHANTPTERGFVSLGSETPAAQMPTSATATYKGVAFLEIAPKSGFTGASDRTGVRGALTLNADFGKRTIAGSVDSIGSRTAQNAFVPISGGSMAVGSGKISGNGLTATMTPNAAVTTAVGNSFSGAVKGAFYGASVDGKDDAAELGGTVAVTGANVVGSGFVNARKQ